MPTLTKSPLSDGEKILSDAFNNARIGKIRCEIRQRVSTIHARNGSAREVFQAIHDGNVRIQLILNHA